MDFSKTSAVILVKNGGQTLQEYLESLNCFDEIVLLDNQSSDNTLEIATTFKKHFPNLTIHHSEFKSVFSNTPNSMSSRARFPLVL